MNSSNNSEQYEVLDDVDTLIFLCDRLHERLNKVTVHVDELKKMWTNKRQLIDNNSNALPLIAQKASKCNRILLIVAEKLAAVEIQTESLHNLHSFFNKQLTHSMLRSDGKKKKK
jgi:hypothetical protein